LPVSNLPQTFRMFSYEKMNVYVKAYHTNQKIYRFLKHNTVVPLYLKDQLGRASFSVVLNIAEGSAKFSSKDRRNFFVTARASVFECSSIINFLCGEGEMSAELKSDLYSSYEEISRMLFFMISNLDPNKSTN
jgi:four helix bundle protein